MTATLTLHRDTVRPDWVDYNNHMNVAYYAAAFDRATEAFFDRVGIGRDLAEAAGRTMFALEVHVTYQRELRQGDPLRIELQLLGADDKRLHFFLAMHHDISGYRAATAEIMALHVDLADRRAAPFPPEAAARIGQLWRAHETLSRPAEAGRSISLGAHAPNKSG